MSKIFLDPRVLLQKEMEIPKLTVVRHYHMPYEWKLLRLPFNAVQIMGYEYWKPPNRPLPLENIVKQVSLVRRHGRFVIGEVWCESQEDRVTTAKRLAEANVDAITVQEQYGQFGMTTEQFNEIAEEARKIKPDVLMGLVEAEYQQLDAVFGHYPEKPDKANCDYFGVGVFRDFEDCKEKMNILRERARTYGRLALVDVDFADPAKSTFDPTTFRDYAMLAYNMVDGVVAWGIAPYSELAGRYPWRERFYNCVKTFESIREERMVIRLWKDRTIPANTTAYGLELVLPTNDMVITVHNTKFASYEFLVSYDQGAKWWSLGFPIFGEGWKTFIPDKKFLPVPCYLKLDCRQGSEEGVLNGWISYGRNLHYFTPEPKIGFWVNGADQTAPPAGTSLVGFQVAAGALGRVRGWYISSPEANDFEMYVGDTGYRIASLASAGVVHFTSDIPIVDNIPAGLWISILNVNAGSPNMVYRASLLLDQVVG